MIAEILSSIDDSKFNTLCDILITLCILCMIDNLDRKIKHLEQLQGLSEQDDRTTMQKIKESNTVKACITACAPLSILFVAMLLLEPQGFTSNYQIAFAVAISTVGILYWCNLAKSRIAKTF